MRVELSTSHHINERIALETKNRIASYHSAGRDELTRLIKQLDREWDVERVLEANAVREVSLTPHSRFGRMPDNNVSPRPCLTKQARLIVFPITALRIWIHAPRMGFSDSKLQLPCAYSGTGIPRAKGTANSGTCGHTAQSPRQFGREFDWPSPCTMPPDEDITARCADYWGDLRLQVSFPVGNGRS